MHLSVNFLPIHFAVPMDYLLQNASTVASANNSLYNDRHFVSQHNSFPFHVNTEILVSIKEPVFSRQAFSASQARHSPRVKKLIENAI